LCFSPPHDCSGGRLDLTAVDPSTAGLYLLS
jgi:hypothetical protein